MSLPRYVHRVVQRNGHVALWYQRNRNTPIAGPRVRLPDDPQSPEFWTAYKRLHEGPAIDPKSVRALVRDFRGSAEWKELAEATQRDYGRYLDQFEAEMGEFRADQISARVVLQMRDAMADRPTTANHFVAVMKALFTWGVPREFATVNPARELKRLKTDTDPYEPWPQWALDLVLAEARWEVQTFVALALYTGQRTADVVAMRLQDIDKDRIAVKQSKTGKRLLIPIHRDLAPTIKKCRERGSIYLVPGERGRKHSTDSWRALWGRELEKDAFRRILDYNREREEAGRFGIVPHGLRKNAVVALDEVGCTTSEIQSITGQSRQMVEHYLRGRDQVAAAERAVRKWEGDGK